MSQWLTCKNCGAAFSSPRWKRFCQPCGGDQYEYEALWAALAGAAILGDGRVGLILDVNNLIHLDGEAYGGAAAAAQHEAAVA